LVVAAAVPVAAEDAVIDSVDCSGLQLSLEGADHYYWIAPENDRVVLVRQCVATEADCDHDVVTVWDRDGRGVLEAAPFLDIPEMSGGKILDAALRTPGRLVVSAIVGTIEFYPVLAEYDIGTGELLRVVPTGSVQCLDLHGDDQGVTWCLGADTAKRALEEDFNLVYRYDEVGALRGSSLPRSAFPATSDPIANTWRGNDRGGFLEAGGRTRLWLPAVGELISFDDEGGVSDRLALPTAVNQQRSRLVAAPDGGVYAMLIAGEKTEPGTWTQGLYHLADNGASWLPIEGLPSSVPMHIALVGADDAGLVLLDRKTLVLCHLPLATEVNKEE
jgi:hypothetical protein